MEYHIYGLSCALLLLSTIGSPGVLADVPKELVRANNAFAINLYQALRTENQDKNLFFSPLAVAATLNMVKLGARGRSDSQISDAFPADTLGESKLHKSFSELISTLYKPTDDYLLRRASKLYAKTDAEILQEFAEKAQDTYGVGLQKVSDFNDSGLADEINDWVSKETDGKIRRLVSRKYLADLESLLSIDATYLKANWDRAFDPHHTKSEVFTTSHDAVHVNMMKQKAEWYDMTDDKTRACFVLELPFVNGDLSMLAVLPWEQSSLSLVEDQFDEAALNFWEEDLFPEKAEVDFPKFLLEETLDLSSVLSTTGLPDLFSKDANFEGITGDRSLHLSGMLHKAAIKVDETGSKEGAASTKPDKNRRFVPKPYRLHYQRPFMFLVRDRRTNAILFLGRLVDIPEGSRNGRDEL